MTKMDGAGPVYDQDSFQRHADDGTESGSTIIDTNLDWNQIALDTNIRLRFLIQNVQTASGLENFQFTYIRNGVTTAPINGSSTFLRSASSIHLTEAEDTTQRLGSGTFQTSNAGVDEVDGAIGNIFFPIISEVELEFCFQARSVEVLNGDVYRLFVKRANDTLFLATYTEIADMTIGEGALVDPIMSPGIIPWSRP